MHRRQFLQGLATSGLLSSVGVCQEVSTQLPSKDVTLGDGSALSAEQLMNVWRQRQDQLVDTYAGKQNLNPQSPFFGGFPSQHRIYHVGAAAQYGMSMVAAFVDPKSAHHHSERFAESIQLAAKFLEKMQHDDGTIDLLSTNFHSPPDTAFVVRPVAMSLRLIQRFQPNALPEFQEIANRFLVRAGNALTVGGIHTPNHRWVVCRALALLNSLIPNMEYVERIDRWLLEGIDIDADGQYTEKSVAGYSPKVNHCFITVARLLNRDALLEPVRKNLQMTKYYLHANGELVTEASNRQDKYQVKRPAEYYYGYRYMALKDRDAEFAGMARLIESVVGAGELRRELVPFMDDPFLQGKLPPGVAPPTNYVKSFPHSGLVRIRRGAVDASLVSDNDRLLTFFKGDAALQAVRFASAFFGKGQLVGKWVEQPDGRFRLSQELTGPYFQPFPRKLIKGDGDWAKMPKSGRAQSEVMTLRSNVTVQEQSGKLRIGFDIAGTDRVPVTLELAFRSGGVFSGVKNLGDDRFLLQDGFGTYRMGDDEIQFGPGSDAHEWTQLRGAEPKLEGSSVYITGYTPFKFELRIA